jgi:iron complex outermembrane receptor protein
LGHLEGKPPQHVAEDRSEWLHDFNKIEEVRMKKALDMIAGGVRLRRCQSSSFSWAVRKSGLLALALAMLSVPALADDADTTSPKQPAPVTKNEPVQLTDIDVKAIKPSKIGSAEGGYRAESVSVGPLGDKDPMETPVSIYVVPGDILQNQPTTGMTALTKYVPSAQYEARGGMFIGRPQTRGFEGTISENNRLDGLNVTMTTAYPMEQFERIEIMTGLGGSLYGPASPSGVFNLVLKRPTAKPFYELDVGNVSYDTQVNTYYHADLSGPLGNDFGYRVNLLYDSGHEWAESSAINRKLASLALDWHGLPKTVVELNFSYYELLEKGFPAGFSFGSSTKTPSTTNIRLPEAPDPTSNGFGQSWAGYDLTTRTASIRVKHEFSDDWHLTFGFLDQNAARNVFQVLNTLTDNSGNYRTTFGALPNANTTTFIVDSELLYLNGRVKTGDITHDLVLGTSGQQRSSTSLSTPFVVTKPVGTANINAPVSFAEPAWQQFQDSYISNVIQEQALNVVDTLTYKSWSALLSLNYSWLNSSNYNVNGGTTSKSRDEGFSYGAGISYKPFENTLVYFSYADSLQQGDTAPASNPPTATVHNGNVTLPPYRSTQYETGVKVSLDKIDLTTALFRIERPYAFVNNEVFSTQGDQVNYGLEMMAVGEIIDRVKVYGGVTILNPKLQNTDNPNTDNKDVIGVPKIQGNVYLEYRMPFIAGLTPSLNVHYTGRRAADAENVYYADAYATLDLGVRYVTRMFEKQTTFRVTANNVTNEKYWACVMPSNTSGAGTLNTAYLGTPREIIVSMQMNF